MPSLSAIGPVVVSVDDDDDAHLLLKRAFSKAGVRVDLRFLNDGSDAIRYLSGEGEFADREKHPVPVVMLLDLKMPKINGFSVLQFLKDHPALNLCPVLVFSSSNNDEDVRKSYLLGCDTYVVKPTTFEKLIDFAKALQRDFLDGSKEALNKDQNAAVLSGFTARRQPAKNPDREKSMERRINPAESPEFFRLLVEQVKDYAIFMLDTSGTILSWNEGARRMKGYEAHEIIGKHFSTFYPRADLESEKPAFELRMATEMGRYEEEGWRVRKDGSRFWCNVVITPLRTADGKLTGFAKVTRDLTQRKLQEEHFQRLLESEERFRLLVEQVRDYAIFILDAKGNIASWNQGARRIKGYSSDEIIGKHFSTFYTSEDLATDKPARELTIAIREGRYEEEGWRLRKDGGRFWASVVITSLWDKRGNLTGFAKVTRDLTQRKREEEALRQRTAELEVFAHTLSHDLRAPLRSVASFAQILKTEAAELSPEDRAAYLEKILKAAGSMETLINDILKLSQLSLAPAPDQIVQLEEVIDEAMDFLESEVRGKNARIDITRPLPSIQGNRTLLVQIFSNLLANALKFNRNGENPFVEIYAEVTDFNCKLHVRDHGIGVEPEYQETIFNMFERGGARPDSSGSGVGLAIVKKAAERLGGSVEIHSQPGQGSDFVVALPCTSSQPAELEK
jgi:PAS domain S-box-containing protein